jgi:outer membrane protein OmpA-like peptidoglycan-associated protein
MRLQSRAPAALRQPRKPRGDIAVIFRRALAAQPILPHHFRLYFILGSDELTPDSKIAYRAVFDDIKQRPVYEIEVVGFTDTLGDLAYNQTLSLARPAAIRGELVRDGLDRDTISIAGRGKRDPLVPTADQTPDPAIVGSRSLSGSRTGHPAQGQ